MTKNDIISTIMTIENATFARSNKTNFIAIPCEDGIVKVSVSSALATDTKNHKAFNMDAAVAEYKAWQAESELKAAEKANKPEKKVNEGAQLRRDALDNAIASLPEFENYTATDIMNAVNGTVDFTLTPMNVGQSARRLVEKGILTAAVVDKKTVYSK